MLLDKTHRLEEDKNALVQLVSSGQELLAEMVKENESLEQQLAHQVTSRGLNLLPNTNSEKLVILKNSFFSIFIFFAIFIFFFQFLFLFEDFDFYSFYIF